MKKFFGFILAMLCVMLGLLAVNYETDFFSNIGEYIPALAESDPELTDRISRLSSDISGYLALSNHRTRPGLSYALTLRTARL